MIGWVIVSIILILLAFGLGRRQGKRAASHSPQQLDALGEAWQRGYDEAVRYLGQSGGKAPAEPAVDEALGAPGGAGTAG